MSLFTFSGTAMAGPADWRIETPQGLFVTVATGGSSNTCQLEPDEAYRLSRGGRLFVWDGADCRLELLRSSVEPMLVEGNAVDGCEAAVWRFQARADDLELVFDCGWEMRPAAAVGGPASGQTVDALTWTIGSGELSLGTENGELLRLRAAQGDGLPERLEPILGLEAVEYSAQGLRVTLPPLVAGERGEMRFLVAWNVPIEEGDASTWFAVDLPSVGFILDQAGCK